MKLSIIIPFYNSEKYLNGCLNSVCKQIKNNVEIILVNDCSTDRSIQICKKFLKKYNFLQIINVNKNRGVSYCRNLGIKKSRGEYIAFLDSDDQYLRGGINIILNNIKKYNNIDLLVLSGRENNKNIIDKNQFFDENSRDEKRNILDCIKNFNKFRATCWNFIIKKNILLLNNIKFKNIKVFEDQAFVSDVLCLIDKYKIIAKPIYAKNTAETDSLSKKTGQVVARSCAQTIYEVSKILNLRKNFMNKKKIRFLLSRINFVIEQLLLNILVCKKTEVDDISNYLFKHFSYISKLPTNYIKKKMFFLKKKEKIKKSLFEYKFSKTQLIKKLFDKIGNNKVIIFCAGSYSEIILKILVKLGKNTHYFEKKLYNIVVKNPQFLEKKVQKFSKYKFLICNKDNFVFDKIKKQLDKIGFSKKNIIHVSI